MTACGASFVPRRSSCDVGTSGLRPSLLLRFPSGSGQHGFVPQLPCSKKAPAPPSRPLAVQEGSFVWELAGPISTDTFHDYLTSRWKFLNELCSPEHSCQRFCGRCALEGPLAHEFGVQTDQIRLTVRQQLDPAGFLTFALFG